jgi:8-oxo-dGTP diphosphatase
MSEVDSFFKSAFSVDNVIFGFDGGDLKVLLIQRGAPPYKGRWALPGDLVYPNEDIDTAAERVLEQLTGLKGVYLEQVKAFGAVNRHPLGRVITIAYYSLVKTNDSSPPPLLLPNLPNGIVSVPWKSWPSIITKFCYPALPNSSKKYGWPPLGLSYCHPNLH